MSEILKVPYEISVWEDYQGYDDEGKANTYLSERKIAVIGSDTMTSPLRAVNGKFNKKVNGEKTLTFEMYSKYWENNELLDNPWCGFLVNERKVKLKYEGEWYDFIVKNVKETSTDYKYAYECTDLAINELSKTGFSLEFDTELQNNCGTAPQLVGAILNNCDWSYESSQNDTIIQENNEVVYQARLVDNIDTYEQGSDNLVKLQSGEPIYIYYSTYLGGDNEYYQFIHSTNLKIENDGSTILIDENTKELYTKTAPRLEDVRVSGYRANKKIRNPEKFYDPILKQYVTKYKRNVEDDSNVYYGYSKSQYLDATCVVNQVANAENFKASTYWTPYSTTGECYSEVSAQIFPRVNASTLKDSTFGQYLQIQISDNENDVIFNDGINQNKGKIDNFVKGESYVFGVDFREVSTQEDVATEPSDEVPEQMDFDLCVLEYILNKDGSIDFGDEIFEATADQFERTDGEDEFYAVVKCQKDKSYKDLLSAKCGIFLKNFKEKTYYFIKKLEFYKYYPNSDTFYKPNDVPQSNVITNYYYYNSDQPTLKTEPDEYVYTYQNSVDSNEYIPIYGEGEQQFEKRRSINEKESNRFNLIQTVCETFECWSEFNIYHNEDGTIQLTDKTYYTPWVFNENDVTREVMEFAGGPSFVSFKNDVIYYYDEACTQVCVDLSPVDGRKYYTELHRFNEDVNVYTYTDFVYVPVNAQAIYDRGTNYFVEEERRVQYKTVSLLQTIDKPNHINFSYGINLKSIQRTLDSSDIVSKIIVKDNSCEYATNGFCSIARSKENPVSENYIYNFEYYTRQGLINGRELNNDLYGINGLYPTICEINSAVKSDSDKAAELSVSILNLRAQAKVYMEARDAAIKERQQCYDDLASPMIGYRYQDFYDIFDGIDAEVRVPIAYVTKQIPNNLYFCTKDCTIYLSGNGQDDYKLEMAVSQQITNPDDDPETGARTYKGYDLGTGTLTSYTSGMVVNGETGKYQYAYYKGEKPEPIYNFRAEDMIIFEDDGVKSQEVYSLITSIQTLNSLISYYDDAYTVTQRDLLNKQRQYNEYQDKLRRAAIESESAERKFIDKYSRYIQEGSWTDDNYLDDDLYYFDALNVLYTSAFPKVSYTIDVIDLHALSGYEAYTFDVGDKTTVEDTEFFGWIYLNGIKTPARENVVVSEVEYSLEDNSQNKITVQNYKTQFEDLFQRIAATTQSMEYHSGEYSNAAGVLVSGADRIDSAVIQNSLNHADVVIKNATNSTVEQGPGGILITNGADPNQQVRLNGAGIAITNDGNEFKTAITGYGISADVITTGRLDTGMIRILNNNQPTFRWDQKGIVAYYYTMVNGSPTVVTNTGVVFNQYGLYGTNKLDEINSQKDINEKANFSLTWDGLNIGQTIKLGLIEVGKDSRPGLALYDEKGNLTLYSTNDGVLESMQGDNITTFGIKGNYALNVNNKFTVTPDGRVHATEITCDSTQFSMDTIQTVGSKFIFKNSSTIEAYTLQDNGQYVITTTTEVDQSSGIALIVDGGFTYECEVKSRTKNQYSVSLTSNNSLLNPTQIVFLGAKGEGIITINASEKNDKNQGDIYSPLALTVSELDIKETDGVTTAVYNKKLIIGQLNGYGGSEGYGLYCDNVFLKGQLISQDETGNQAGIDSRGVIRDKSDEEDPLIFYSKVDEKYPFYITKRGYLYAEQGEFSGAIKSAEINTARINGTGSGYGLTINCGEGDINGISFWHGGAQNLVIDTTGNIKASEKANARINFSNQEIDVNGRFRLQGSNEDKSLMYRKSANGYNLYCL